MDVFCHQRHLFMADTYALAEHISQFGVYLSSGLLALSSGLAVFFTLFAKETLKYACRSPSTLAWLILGGAIYSGTIVTLATLNYSLGRFKVFQRASTLDKVKLTLTKALSFFFFPLEFVILELKSIFVVLIISSSHLQAKLEETWGIDGYTAVFSVAIADFVLTAGMAYFKILFLRQEVPDGSYFARIPGNFETMFLIAVPLTKFCALWNNQYGFSDLDNFEAMFMTSQSKIFPAFYFVHLCILVIVLVVYLYELPYYHAVTERYFGHSVLTLFTVQAAIGIADYSYRGIALLLCLLVPLQVVFIEIYIEHTYEDKLDLGQSQKSITLTKIKMILTGRYNGQSKETLKNLFLKRILGKEEKVISEEAQILEAIVEERETTVIALLKKNCLDTKPIESSDFGSKNSAKFKRQRHLHASDIKDDIYYQMISKYVEQAHHAQIACLIKLEWMLKEKFVILEVLTLLNRILRDQATFRSRYICFYALKLTEKKLGFFYRMKETAENGYKDLNNVGLDLDAVLEYKKYMQTLVASVEDFANLNKKTIQLITTDSSDLRSIYSQESKLYEMNREIDREFKVFHANTLKTEYYHLVPYFYHLMYNTNLYRSSKKVYQLFISRFSEVAKNYLESNHVRLDNLSAIFQSTTFQCDSDRSTLSLITNVYGHRSDEYQPCVGKYPDVILPKVQNQYHYQSMANFMKSNNTNQIMNVNVGFTKMPDDHLTFKAVITIKIVPRLDKNFDFMVNLMERQNPEDYYILVNQSLEVDSYSKNLAKIVEKRFLVPGIAISNISKKAEKFIKKVLAESRQIETKLKVHEAAEKFYELTSHDVKKEPSFHTGYTNYEEQNIAEKMVHDMSRKRLDFAEDLVFGANKKSAPKPFVVRISFNRFKYVAGGYFLLHMRDSNSLKLGEVKKKIATKNLKNAINSNFILSFNTQRGSSNGERRGAFAQDQRDNLMQDSYSNIFEDEADLGNTFRMMETKKGDSPANQTKDNYKGFRVTTTLFDAPSDIDESKAKNESKNGLPENSFKVKVSASFEGSPTESKRDHGQVLPISEPDKEEKQNLDPNPSPKPRNEISRSATKRKREKGYKRQSSRKIEGGSNSSDGENSVKVNQSGSGQRGKAVVRAKEEQKMLTRSSIVTVDASMGYKHNKMVYEDICTRKISPAEIKANHLHMVVSVLFVIAFIVAVVLITLEVNNQLASFNDFYLSYFAFKFQIQQITQRILFRFGLDTGKIADDRYAFLGLPKVASATKYVDASLSNLQSSFSDRYIDLLEETVQSQHSVSSLLFTQNIDLSENFLSQLNATAEATGKANSYGVRLSTSTIFEAFIIDTYSKISRLVWEPNSTQFSPFYLDSTDNVISHGLQFVGQYFLTYDSLNTQPLSRVEDLLANSLLDSQDKAVLNLTVIFICASLLGVGLAAVQIMIVRNLSKKIFRVFISFHLVGDSHIRKRLEQLDNMYLLMRDIREGNYLIRDQHRKENFESLTKRLRQQMPDLKVKQTASDAKQGFEEQYNADNLVRNRRLRYAKGTTFFSLFSAYIAIVLQFLAIFAFSILVSRHYSALITTKSNMLVKEKEVNQLGLSAAILHNYFLADYFFANEKLLLNNERAAQGIETMFAQVTDSWFPKVDNIFAVTAQSTGSFISDFRDRPSCEVVPSLESVVDPSIGKTLCQYGTLGVLNQSLFTGMVSMYRQFTDFFRSVKTGKSTAEKSLDFQERRTREWEIYMNEIYYPTTESLIANFRSSTLSAGTSADHQAAQVVTLLCFVFLLVYAALNAFTLSRLIRQIYVSRFAFQIFSMKAVLENNKVKARFLEFFGVNNREFI